MNCPIAGAQGQCVVDGTGSNGILILGDFLEEGEAFSGKAFSPNEQSGSVLERAIRRIGATRDMFSFYNAIPTFPSRGIAKEIEDEAIGWGRPYIEAVIEQRHPRVIVACGEWAVKSTTGLCGRHLSVFYLAGYVLPHCHLENVAVIPCFHPRFLRQGAMSHLGVLMRCLRLAILVSRGQRQPVQPPFDAPPSGYQLMPSEAEAAAFLEDAKRHTGFLAYDIETNYSTDEAEAEEHFDDIRSVQFSLAQGSGIFLPWRVPYREIAQEILATTCRKISWNGWRFDDPRLRDNGCRINGELIDLMWAWHHAQPDLPRKLQFAAAMQGPNIYTPSHSWPWPWKHLDKQSPAFYGIVDVDVLQWMVSY
jgi:uracil-DNA glycosylase family 4